MLENIKIEEVVDYFPSLVRNKILKLDASSLKELSELDPTALANMPGLGSKSARIISEIIIQLKNEPEAIIDYWNESQRVFSIPSNAESYIGISLLINSITEYFSLKNEESILSVLTFYYALNQNKSYNIEEIGHFLDYSPQNIRNLIRKGLAEIRSSFSQVHEEDDKLQISNNLKDYYNQLMEVLSQNELHSELSINRELNECGLTFSKLDPNTLRLIVDLAELTTCGSVETRFTQTSLYVNQRVDKGTIVDTATALNTSLIDSILSLSEIDVVIQVRKKKRKANIETIERLCSILPEIEVYEGNSTKQIQIGFTSLGNARDRAYRVLHDNGKSMYIDDIVSEVNRKMIEGGDSRIYTRHTLALASDARFRSKQKTGYWDLAEWELNSDSIEDNVKRALIRLDKPSTYDEIIENIHSERPELKVKSIRALIGKVCLKVENEKFILPEWKNMYSDLALAKKRHRINTSEHDKTIKYRNEIIDRILKQPKKEIDAKELAKDLVENGIGHTRQRIYKLLDDPSVFKKTKKANGQIQVSLVQNTRAERIDLDELNWTRVKQVITRELEERFNDARQPAYSLTFENCLELFKRFLDWNSSEELLNGLSERIIPSIDKYYASPDRNDRLNILKQLLTSLDPFLKKILFLINPTDYIWIKSNKKGLGEVIGKLSKLDPRNNRFEASVRNCSVNRWGKEINLAYQNRNVDTHNAKTWSDTQIISIINATIVIMLYSVFEYENEIKNGI